MQVVILRYFENTLGHFLRKEERFLVVEANDASIAISKVSVNWREKKLRIINRWSQDISWHNDTSKTFSFLQKTFKRIPRLQVYGVVLVLDPRLATTVHASAKIIRDNGRKVIDEADLDNLVSQAVWQVFDRYRAWSANKMSVDELDLLLVDVKIRNLKIDNHRVLNPLGFPAKTVEVFLSQTFTSREFFETIRALLPQNHLALISEMGVVGCEALSRIEKKDGFVLADFAQSKSDLYLSLGNEYFPEKIVYLDSFNLGRRDLYANFGKYFLVQATVAEMVMQRYAKNEVSPLLAKKVERLIQREWAVFCDGITSIVADSRDLKSIRQISVFLHTKERLPELFYSQPLHLKDGRRLELIPVALKDAASHLGFQIHHRSAACSFFTLAGLLDIYYYSDDWLNKLANRRLRWLMPRAR